MINMNRTQTNVPDAIFVDVDDTILDWSGEMMQQLAGYRDISGVTIQYKTELFGGATEIDKALVMSDLGFWRSLKLTRLGHALLAAITDGEFQQNVILLTATPPLMDVPPWINNQVQRAASQAKRELGAKFGLPVAVVTSHNTYEKWAKAKAAFAGPRKVLIDDSKSMIDAFTAAGGQGVLVPKPWNDAPGEDIDAFEILRFLCEPIEGLDF